MVKRKELETMELNILPSTDFNNGEKTQNSEETQYLSSSKNCINNSVTYQESNLPDSIKSNSMLHSLSNLYAQLMVVVAGFMVLTEVLHSSVPLFYFQEYVFNYLLCGGIICLAITYVRAWSYRLQVRENMNTSLFCAKFLDNALPSGISMYFRIGTLAFGFCTLFSCGLEVISIFTMTEDCAYGANSVQPLLRGIFTFLQMLFLFLNVEVIIDTFGWFRHAALMHLVSTNLAVWIRILLWESSKIWLDAMHFRHNSSINWNRNELNITVHTIESDAESSNPTKHIPNHKVHFTSHCWWSAEAQQTEGIIAFHLCLQNSTVGVIWEKIMPYLYPIIVQYCICASAIIYITWSNRHFQSLITGIQSGYLTGEAETPTNNQACAGSTKGFFLGSMMLITGVVVTILFFALPERNGFHMTFVVHVLECGIFCVSSLAAGYGLFQLKKLPYWTFHHSVLHNVLQNVGIFAVYSLGVCNAIAGGMSIRGSEHIFVGGILLLLQATTQSLFIQQALKKRLYSPDLNKKPQAQIVIWLSFVNIVLWLLESFTIHGEDGNQLQVQIFGNIAWPVISKMISPLVIFYRFHSAVLLMEVWKNCYSVK